MVSIPFCIFCVLCEITQFSNKVFCSHWNCSSCRFGSCLFEGFLFLIWGGGEDFCHTWRNHSFTMNRPFWPPPPSSHAKKGLSHDNWAPGLCTNHMTERVLSTNHCAATAGLCDVSQRVDFFVQPSVLLVWLITFPQSHTRSLLFLHADNKSSTANPHFSPGVLMVLVMGGMRQTMFLWEPEYDLNQI